MGFFPCEAGGNAKNLEKSEKIRKKNRGLDKKVERKIY
jgi:hypothetical protein